MNKKHLMLALAFATCMVAGTPAFAQDWQRHDQNWQHHDNGNHYGWNNHDHFNSHQRSQRYYTPPYPTFRDHDRVVIREYYAPVTRVVYRPVAPAWRVGYVLPTYTRYEYLSPRLLSRLQLVPVGYEYVKVDGNVLLVEDATRLIVDALTLS